MTTCRMQFGCPSPKVCNNRASELNRLGASLGLIVRRKGRHACQQQVFLLQRQMTIGPVHSSLLQALATTASSVDSTEAIRLRSGRSDVVLFREVAKPLLVEIFSIRTHAD